ncbi:hypothetical protein BBK14_09530 [Parafrankia soli]|uniref:Uncharacterized protein n=1 Tax=Parafrankia soli TaxID=2599596 RepID=A0A1S1RHZ8_9ACTN|nr:hypothetical protein [Parafrankia soli]OHV45005.1 hypothetical protein BBK14_09530 [Parafrankia soli]
MTPQVTGDELWHTAAGSTIHPCTVRAPVAIVHVDSARAQIHPRAGAEQAVSVALGGTLTGPAVALPRVLARLVAAGVVMVLPADVAARVRLHAATGRPLRSRRSEHGHELRRLSRRRANR